MKFIKLLEENKNQSNSVSCKKYMGSNYGLYDSFMGSTLAHSFVHYFGVECVRSARDRERIHSSQPRVKKHAYSMQSSGAVAMVVKKQPLGMVGHG